MNSYDLRSYELAVLLRTRKTIVVEGVTDKRVLARMLLEEESISGSLRDCVIDEVSILSREASFSGLGNRQKVINTGVHLSGVTPKLKCLVDREWDGVNLDNLQDPHPPVSAPAWGYITHGHSIENYWFTVSAACSFLKMQYGAELHGDFFVKLTERFESMLRISAAFSLAAKRLNIITTCQKGLLKTDHVIWLNGAYLPTGQLTLAGRQRLIGADLMLEIQVELERADFSALSLKTVQWLCHGHLGEQMLRVCAANLAKELGNQDIAESIERGFQDIKLSHDANWLAAEKASIPVPLDCLVAWAA
jgi:hypothetical protein